MRQATHFCNSYISIGQMIIDWDQSQTSRINDKTLITIRNLQKHV